MPFWSDLVSYLLNQSISKQALRLDTCVTFCKMDLPEVIGVHRRLPEECENESRIAGDMADFDWTKQIGKSYPTVMRNIIDALTAKTFRYVGDYIRKQECRQW